MKEEKPGFWPSNQTMLMVIGYMCAALLANAVGLRSVFEWMIVLPVIAAIVWTVLGAFGFWG